MARKSKRKNRSRRKSKRKYKRGGGSNYRFLGESKILEVPACIYLENEYEKNEYKFLLDKNYNTGTVFVRKSFIYPPNLFIQYHLDNKYLDWDDVNPEDFNEINFVPGPVPSGIADKVAGYVTVKIKLQVELGIKDAESIVQIAKKFR